MVNGDIVYMQFPLTSDVNASAEIILTEPIIQLFPTADYDILLSKIIQIGGNNGVFRNVVLVVARSLT